MESFISLLILLVVLASVLIIGLVLLQPSKDAGLGGLSNTGNIGAGSSVLGSNRNTFAGKLTWILGVFVIIASLLIGGLQARIQAEKERRENSSLLHTIEEEKIPAKNKEDNKTEKK